MLYMFIAPGFEEMEAVGTLDLLRRAELEVKTVGLGGKTVEGSHGIAIVCDLAEGELNLADAKGIILPGGLPGTLNLEASKTVQDAVKHAVDKGLLISAICAAPAFVLGRAGLLKGKKYTCYPSCEQGIEGDYTASRVERDGLIITGRSPGCVVPFALEIIKATKGNDVAASVEAALQQ